MPSLILLRHAKSLWDANAPVEDMLRPLTPRGCKAADQVGRFLARTQQIPDAAMVSPALRAQETLRRAMTAGKWSCIIRDREGLYNGGARGVLSEIRKEQASTELLLLVGHEPTWSNVASLIIGGGQIRLPTAALVRIDLTVPSWSDVAPDTGVLTWLVTPPIARSAKAK